MTPAHFDESNVVIAKDQPQFTPLPAHIDISTGRATFCWQLGWRERFQLLRSGKLWHQVLTNGHALQPQLLHTKKPELG